MRRHAVDLDAVAEPRLVHWDLWDPNVYFEPVSLTVTGVIDFERVLWWETPMEAQFLHERANDRIVHEYGNHLFDQPSAIARRRLYDLYLFFVMFIECAYRKYPTDDIEQAGRTGPGDHCRRAAQTRL